MTMWLHLSSVKVCILERVANSTLFFVFHRKGRNSQAIVGSVTGFTVPRRAIS